MSEQIRIKMKKKDIATKLIKTERLSPEETKKRIEVEQERVNRRGENSGLIPNVPQELKKKYPELIKEAGENPTALQTWKRFHNRKWTLPKDERRTLEGQWWNTKAVMKAVGRSGIKGFLRKIFRKNK